jgi:hypothetical protein
MMAAFDKKITRGFRTLEVSSLSRHRETWLTDSQNEKLCNRAGGAHPDLSVMGRYSPGALKFLS